jgi:hypothetical protein
MHRQTERLSSLILPLKNGYLRVAFFLLTRGFLNGLGTALFGTERTVFSAFMNRSEASGPSSISA